MGRAVRLAVIVAMLFGCSRSAPSLLDGRDHRVVSGKDYRFSIPLAGCGAPVVSINGKHWRPDRDLFQPFPAAWHDRTSGNRFHTTTYVTGTMRVVGGHIEAELRDGTAIRYRVTSERYPSNVCQ